MSNYLAAIWKCRYFWMSLVQMDLRTRYRRSALGMGWSLLHPIVMTAVLCTVFAKLWGLNIREYAPFLLVGMCFWNYISAVTTHGCQCLFQGEAYIRQYPAPMAIYPLRTMLGASVHFAIALCVVVLLTWIFNGFGNVPALFSLAPTLLLLLMMGWSMAVLAGFSTAYFPDTQHLSEVGMQILFYATPVIYPPEVLRKKGLGWIADFNPLASFIELLREPLLNGTVPGPKPYLIALLTVAIVSTAAATTLVRLQQRIIFQL